MGQLGGLALQKKQKKGVIKTPKFVRNFIHGEKKWMIVGWLAVQFQPKYMLLSRGGVLSTKDPTGMCRQHG